MSSLYDVLEKRHRERKKGMELHVTILRQGMPVTGMVANVHPDALWLKEVTTPDPHWPTTATDAIYSMVSGDLISISERGTKVKPPVAGDVQTR